MFIFNGISSETMGVIANEEDFMIRASKQIEQININGRNGSVYNELAYQDVTSSFELKILYHNTDEVLNWLNGKGIFEYNGRETEMMFYTQQEIKRDTSINSLKVDYIRSPFWKKSHDQFKKVTKYITNYGNAVSYPILKLVGTGAATLTINNITLKYNFLNDKEVIIDCEKMIETNLGLSKSKQIEIGFQYPFLYPGVNEVVVSNAELFVMRKDFWL